MGRRTFLLILIPCHNETLSISINILEDSMILYGHVLSLNESSQTLKLTIQCKVTVWRKSQFLQGKEYSFYLLLPNIFLLYFFYCRENLKTENKHRLFLFFLSSIYISYSYSAVVCLLKKETHYKYICIIHSQHIMYKCI